MELSQRFPPAIGGVEATLGELVAHLRNSGVDVEVLTTDVDRVRPFVRGRFDGCEGGVPVRRFRALRLAPLPLGLGVVAPGMFPAAIASDAEVVHAHAFGHYPTWVGAAVRHLRSTPLVVTPHADPGRGLPFSRVYHRAVARATLGSADRIIVQSQTEEAFLASIGVPTDRMVRIPTAIRVEEFSLGPRPEADSPVRLLSVSRLDLTQKDPRTLIRALAQVPPSVAVHLSFIGDDWGGLGSVRALAARVDVARRLTFRTSVPRPELIRAYAAADIFILASHFESFPRVLLEAMAAGLPIIASRVGGISELLREGRNAILVPPEDPTALRDAIVSLAIDPRLRERYGRESRRRAEEFAWQRILPMYLRLFEEVASAPR